MMGPGKHSTMELMDMNDDCIFEIFNWLSLKDLYVTKQLCNRFQQLVIEYFQRKHHNMQISMLKREGKIELIPNEKYLKCFCRYICNVKIHVPSDEDIGFLNFVASNWNETGLQTIQFRGGELYKSYGRIMENILKNVETVGFEYCSGVMEIVKFCHRIKHLMVYISVYINYATNNNTDLLLQKYVTLEYFRCHIFGYEETFFLKLEIFLRKNPQIKRMTFVFTESTTRNRQCIETIVREITNTSELFLSFEMDSVINGDMELILEQLKILNDRDNFKSLELLFEGHHISLMMEKWEENLKQLKTLQGLHLQSYGTTYEKPWRTSWNFYLSYHLDSQLLMDSCSFPNLKILSLSFFGKLVHINISAKTFPNLEALYLCEVDDDNIIQSFVTNAEKMKKIFVRSCECMLEIDKLSLERRKLVGASELTVYTDHSEIKTNWNNEMVKIKRVVFKDDHYNLSSPLTRWWKIAEE